jgi:uncharacterized OB-fold protein
MSLIKCSECGKEVLDKVNFCPSCGNPIKNNTYNGGEEKKVVEVEFTSKKYKKKMILGFLW